MGMDLQEYYISTEWDVMNVPAIRNEKYYPCCEEPYPDIIFYLGYIHILRKALVGGRGQEIAIFAYFQH